VSRDGKLAGEEIGGEKVGENSSNVGTDAGTETGDKSSVLGDETGAKTGDGSSNVGAIAGAATGEASSVGTSAFSASAESSSVGIGAVGDEIGADGAAASSPMVSVAFPSSKSLSNSFTKDIFLVVKITVSNSMQLYWFRCNLVVSRPQYLNAGST
jgi:hypothetical protein